MDIVIVFIALVAICIVLGALIRTLWEMQDLRDEVAGLRTSNAAMFFLLKTHLEGGTVDIKRLTQDGTPIRETDIE